MLTPGLESAIQTGLAEYKTFTFGIGGSSRIPVPKGSFIIITDFDYFYFIDNPALVSEATPAVHQFGFETTEPITDVTWQLSGVPVVPPIITFDNSNPLQAQIDFQAMLDTFFPGFTCSLMFTPGFPDSWIMTVTTTTPGTAYNFLVPSVVLNPIATGLFFSTEFQNGSNGTTSLSNVIANSTHQLEFRSTKSRNHYVIREEFDFFPQHAEISDPLFFYNVKGYFHRDCYLVHTESVQMTIIKVPPPQSWSATIYSAPPNKSQESGLPNGYGQGVGGLNTVRQAQIQPFPTENIMPLTKEFDNLPGVSQDQLKFSVVAGRELTDPTAGIIVGITNERNYPVVNVGYVLIKKDYNDYVNPS